MSKRIISLLIGGVIFSTGVMVGNFTKSKQVEKVEVEKIVEVEKKSEPVQVTNVLYESTDTFKIEEGEIGIELSDGSWASVNQLKGYYIFQPVDLGDWCYELESLEEVENIIKTYIEWKNY